MLPTSTAAGRSRERCWGAARWGWSRRWKRLPRPCLFACWDRYGQWVGVSQLARGPLVCPTRHPVHPRTTLQEGRQRPHRAKELDARAQADGLGALRYGPGGGGHERSVWSGAAFVDERVSALGEAGAQGAGGGAPASGL